ncbi:MAG: hypothetical protein BM485_11315 [Desulfobulbaceae bacterium DB1]|nr:MAG: hypothetical protein BM485_11315 [Desulfobulbaceae bacterium DB1]
MNFQAHLKNMMEMMQEELVVLFVGGLLVQLLCSVTLGLLAGPLMGGYMLLMLQWLRTGKGCEFNDLFAGMRRFGELFPIFFMGLLILLGCLFFLLPGIVLSVWWLYVLPLMAEKNLSLRDAMRASRHKVNEKGFFMHLVFLLMISVVPVFVIAVAATVIPPLAILQYLLFPLQCACLASLYLEQFEDFDPEKRVRSSAVGNGTHPAAPPVPPPLPAENGK